MGTARQYHKKCIQGEYIKGVSQSEYYQRVSSFKYLRKCHNQKYYQGPPQLKVLPWTTTIKGSGAIKHIQEVQQTEVQQGSMTTKECNMQMFCQCVPQSKTFQRSITMERTARTIKRTARQFYNQKYFQECHNQKSF